MKRSHLQGDYITIQLYYIVIRLQLHYNHNSNNKEINYLVMKLTWSKTYTKRMLKHFQGNKEDF